MIVLLQQIHVQCTCIILVTTLHFHEVRESLYSGMQIKLVITQFVQNFAVCNKMFNLRAVICELTVFDCTENKFM